MIGKKSSRFHNEPIAAVRQARIRRALLVWFRRHARPLPWRGTKSPYAIWVSEIMLQQTQVATVIPYYRRFLGAFPSLTCLAQAPLERVFELWSGLGYYRRARYLHLAARKIVGEFGGRFPQEYEKARSLPGIGDYTARAILSIAYDQPYAVLDGNVARVVARLEAIHGGDQQPAFRRAIESQLERLLSRRHPGDFNQALMELGQTLCLPRAPQCPACPLRRWCRGYALRAPERYPQPRPRRAVELRYLATAAIRRASWPGRSTGESVALMRGLDEGLLGDLWNFPSAFGRSQAEALSRLQEKLSAATPSMARRLAWDESRPVMRLRHRITYRSIAVDVYAVEAASDLPAGPLRWFSLESLDTTALSQLARKIATRLRSDR